MPDLGTNEWNAHNNLSPGLARLLTKLSLPARQVINLTSDERALALGVLLAAMVPMDRRVLEVEVDRLNQLAHQHYRISGHSLLQIESMARDNSFVSAEVEVFALHLTERLHIEDRCNLVGLLWEIALCDQHLHELEESAIMAIADRLGVPRKRVSEQQARAATRV